MSKISELDTQIADLKRQLNNAETERAGVVNSNSSEARVELNKIIKQLDVLIYDAERIANEADLKFYYSVGCEEFFYLPIENWSESTAYC